MVPNMRKDSPRLERRPGVNSTHWQISLVLLYYIPAGKNQSYLLIAKVQNGREFLHLLEAEVPLLLKPVPQRTQLGVREHGPDLRLPGVDLVLRLILSALFRLRSGERCGTVRSIGAVLRWWVHRERARRAC